MNGIPVPGEGESLREIDFLETDALLRDDVRRLGAMVGQMLAEQASPALLEQVESVRRMAIARREADAPVDALAQRLSEVPPQGADALVRAFAAYFGATNIAERVHRIRRRRDYQRAGGAPQPGGLEAVLGELRAAGVRYEDLAALLPRLQHRTGVHRAPHRGGAARACWRRNARSSSAWSPTSIASARRRSGARTSNASAWR